MKKTAIAIAIAATMGVSAAQAGQIVVSPVALTTNAANFTMLDGAGTWAGGTNDVQMDWDGTAFTANSDYTGPGSVSNVTAVSTTPFFNETWTAHDIQVFAPGSYTFDTTIGGGNLETGIISMNVGAAQLGIHMLFDWSTSANIDVVVVADSNGVFGSGVGQFQNLGGACQNVFGQPIVGNQCLHDGPGIGSDAVLDGIFVDGGQTWGFVSVDQAGGDGIPGTPMAPLGPFAGFNANFNANLAPVPVPAAVWLFGSGLLGLVGVARRRKSA